MADLFLMPLNVTAIRRSTLGWSFEAAALYRLLLEAQWMQNGVLPVDLKRLKQVACWTGTPRKFERAFGEIQGDGHPHQPKFIEDDLGLFNPKGRAALREVWEKQVASRRGNLKQHGCPSCRQRGQANVADFKDCEGWIRRCPRCQLDLWDMFSPIPWLPHLLPADRADERQEPVQAEERVEPQSQMELSEYCLAVESATADVLGFARPFSAEEASEVMKLHDEGIPLEVVIRTMRSVARRKKGRAIKTVLYFLKGPSGGAIRDHWNSIQATSEPDFGPEPGGQATIGRPVEVECEPWQQILESIRSAVSADEFRMWFSPLRIVEFERSRITAQCPSESIRGIVEGEYRGVIDLHSQRYAVALVA